MGKSRGRGTRGHRPAQEEIDASEEGAAARRAAAAAAAAEESSDSDSDEEGAPRRVSGVAHLIEQANPNDKRVKSAVKLSDLGSLGERSEMKGREKRVRVCHLRPRLPEGASQWSRVPGDRGGGREAQGGRGNREGAQRRGCVPPPPLLRVECWRSAALLVVLTDGRSVRAGKANLARLAEVKARRAEAAAARAAEEAAEPQPEPEQEKEKKKKKGAKKAAAERPVIPVPPPKEMKSALIRLQGCAGDEFLKKHKLNKLSGNKLAKMKRADFEKIIAAFQAEGDLEAIEEFILE